MRPPITKEEMQEVLDSLNDEIDECAGSALDDYGNCICYLYPCWKILADEIIYNAIKNFKE